MRMVALFFIFFAIGCGLGYPVLNRYDPRETPGLSDVRDYAALVTGVPVPDSGHLRFRVLVPWIARPFYRFARGRLASWDPVMFGLLVADALFVAGTALLIIMLGRRLAPEGVGNPAIGVVGALLYMVNFAVANLRLAGLVDAGEGFFLLALLWSLSERALWALPVIGILGAMTKESCVPFEAVIMFAWWLTSWAGFEDDVRIAGIGHKPNLLPDAIWIAVSWGLSLATMVGLQWAIGGRFASPLQFGLALHRGGDYASHFVASLRDRNLWYIFLWLLPTAVPNLKRLPKAWMIPVAAACGMAFVLDAYFGGAPGTAGRALFSIAGPMLSLSSALFVLGISG